MVVTGFSVQTVACNKTTNRKCECAFQYYCATEDVTKCEHCVKCDSGNGPPKGNEIHYREACQTCSSGTFRNTTQMRKCQPHTNCTALGMILRYKGNSTSDNLCEDKSHKVLLTTSKKLKNSVNLYMVLIMVVMTILCILVILRSSQCNTSNIREIGMLIKLRFICICDTEGTHDKCDDNEEETKLKTAPETGRAVDGSISEAKPRILMAMMSTDETEAPTMEYRSEILDIETMPGIGSTEDNIPFPVQENGRNSNTYYPIEEQNQKQYYQPVMTEAKSGIQASSYVHDGKYWLD
ncbi:tumor necrosis factor receptor superfamily member 3-like [Hemitrygon akajei]|uniref:tumor necrosis factor receptor superfamily member 3-like n=1 Tax=Hemitrygon akajei TaxID=2704970 RepID=UPI003BF9C7AB